MCNVQCANKVAYILYSSHIITLGQEGRQIGRYSCRHLRELSPANNSSIVDKEQNNQMW